MSKGMADHEVYKKWSNTEILNDFIKENGSVSKPEYGTVMPLTTARMSFPPMTDLYDANANSENKGIETSYKENGNIYDKPNGSCLEQSGVTARKAEENLPKQNNNQILAHNNDEIKQNGKQNDTGAVVIRVDNLQKSQNNLANFDELKKTYLITEHPKQDDVAVISVGNIEKRNSGRVHVLPGKDNKHKSVIYVKT